MPVRDTQRGARITLRIEIDHQGLEPLHSKGRSKVYRRGCLSDAALLIGHGENPAVRRPRQLAGGGVQYLHRALRRGADRGIGLVGARPRFT